MQLLSGIQNRNSIAQDRVSTEKAKHPSMNMAWINKKIDAVAPIKYLNDIFILGFPFVYMKKLCVYSHKMSI